MKSGRITMHALYDQDLMAGHSSLSFRPLYMTMKIIPLDPSSFSKDSVMGDFF